MGNNPSDFFFAVYTSCLSSIFSPFHCSMVGSDHTSSRVSALCALFLSAISPSLHLNKKHPFSFKSRFPSGSTQLVFVVPPHIPSVLLFSMVGPLWPPLRLHVPRTCWACSPHQGGVYDKAAAAADRTQDPQNGNFWAQKWSELVLPKNDPGPFGKVYGAYLGSFAPVLTRVAPRNAQCLPFLELFGPVLSRFGRKWAYPTWPVLGWKMSTAYS